MSDSQKPHISTQELALKSLEDVQEPIDFRLKGMTRPSQEQLDEGVTRQLSHLMDHGKHHISDDDKEEQTIEESEPVYVRHITNAFLGNGL